MRFLRRGPRPVASVVDALVGVGGIVIAGGITLLAFDAYGEEFNQGPAALVMLGLFALGYVLLNVTTPASHPAWIAMTAIAVPGVFAFLLLEEADSFGDVRLFFLTTLAGWIALFFAPSTRSRPLYIGLSLLLVWAWGIAEVNVGVLESQGPPAPVDTIQRVSAGRAEQADVTLDDLDPSDPLYPLAEDCAGGDDAACDDLWLQSAVGSDFEAFAESCGGRGERGFSGCSASDDSGDDFSDDFGDDFGDDFSEDFDDEFYAPSPLTPFLAEDLFAPSTSQDKDLEMGLVSLVLAVVYLAALVAADRRGYQYVGTAFAFPGAWVLTFAVGFLGAETEEAIPTGVMFLVAGVVLAAIGHLGERRFTTWAGAVMAGLGGVIVSGDIGAIEDSFDDGVDLVQPGIVIALGGLVLVGLGLLARTVVARPGLPGAPGAPPPGEPPGGPGGAPWSTPAPGDTSQWGALPPISQPPPPPPAPAPPFEG